MKQNPDENISNMLFVYGTLRKGFKNSQARYLHQCSEYLGVGFVWGTLYNIGDYPGLKTEGEEQGKVFGDVFKLHNFNLDIADFDEYEGIAEVYPSPHEYTRVLVDVHMKSGVITCWSYLYCWSVEKFEQISGGDYLTFSYH